ncbi:hypothetical protein SAMN05518672_102260 [Chitinophaga sp. CF118]|uniref:hypothetical protein n=1 Tax=Chitinophaga sp. CF118 TaxID=1884367 RepID=UPI0008F3413B|nr:hypothetical protein [Chitinophaga sp. CF118]SFD51585.1 hypothetical protein SAMN05518672_102260 [Chitinophaga sp. CF118]
MRITKILLLPEIFFQYFTMKLLTILSLLMLVALIEQTNAQALQINATDTVGHPFPLQINDNISTLTYGTNTFGRLLRLSRQEIHFYDFGLDAGNEFYITKKNSSDVAFKVNASGNVGIGESNPTEKLMVSGNIALSGTGAYFGVALTDRLTYDGKYQPHYGMQWVMDSWTGAGPSMWMSAYGGMKFFTTGAVRMSISDNGNVGIGTTAPGSNRLAVEGTIAARRIKVTQITPWPDFVFDINYQLPSLQEVENYIIANRHLPNIPSAAEVAKDGQDLGEMNRILLQKVEELTLHLIEQEKRMKEMQSEITDLKKSIK